MSLLTEWVIFHRRGYLLYIHWQICITHQRSICRGSRRGKNLACWMHRTEASIPSGWSKVNVEEKILSGWWTCRQCLCFISSAMRINGNQLIMEETLWKRLHQLLCGNQSGKWGKSGNEKPNRTICFGEFYASPWVGHGVQLFEQTLVWMLLWMYFIDVIKCIISWHEIKRWPSKLWMGLSQSIEGHKSKNRFPRERILPQDWNAEILPKFSACQPALEISDLPALTII